MEAKLKEITNEVARFYNLVDDTGIQMTAELQTGMSEEEVIGIACKAMADIIGIQDFYIDRVDEFGLRHCAFPRSHYVFKLLITLQDPEGPDVTDEYLLGNDMTGGVLIVDIQEERTELLRTLAKKVGHVIFLTGVDDIEGDDEVRAALCEVVEQWQDRTNRGLEGLPPIIQSKLPVGVKVELRDNDEIVIRAA